MKSALFVANKGRTTSHPPTIPNSIQSTRPVAADTYFGDPCPCDWCRVLIPEEGGCRLTCSTSLAFFVTMPPHLDAGTA